MLNLAFSVLAIVTWVLVVEKNSLTASIQSGLDVPTPGYLAVAMAATTAGDRT